MRLYLDIFRFNFLQFVHYPLELLASLLTKLLTVAFLMIFWSLVLKETGDQDQLKKLLGYFLIAEGIGALNMGNRMAYGSYLRKAIKSGAITSVLLLPYRTLPATYVGVLGAKSITMIPAVILMILGVYIYQPAGVLSLFLFLYFVVISIMIGFSFNLLEGILTFHVVQPAGLMSTVSHITRLLSGALVPLNYFPPLISKILILLPFSMMIFTPINMLDTAEINQEVILTCLVGLFWVILLNTFMYFLWKKGLKKYEAIGL